LESKSIYSKTEDIVRRLESKSIYSKTEVILSELESKAVIAGKNSNIIRTVGNKAVIPRKGKGYCQGSRKTKQLFQEKKESNISSNKVRPTASIADRKYQG